MTAADSRWSPSQPLDSGCSWTSLGPPWKRSHLPVVQEVSSESVLSCPLFKGAWVKPWHLSWSPLSSFPRFCQEHKQTVMWESERHSVVSEPLWPHGLHSSPGQNTGVGSLSLLQGIFPTQGSNPGFPHCRQILYQLSYEGSVILLQTHAVASSLRSILDTVSLQSLRKA